MFIEVFGLCALVYVLAGFCVAVTMNVSLREWQLRLQERAETLWPSTPPHEPHPLSYVKVTLTWPFMIFFTLGLVLAVRQEERRRRALPSLGVKGVFDGLQNGVQGAGDVVNAIDFLSKGVLLQAANEKVIEVFRRGSSREEREMLLDVAHRLERALGLTPLPVPSADERGLFSAVFTFLAHCDGEQHHVALSVVVHRAVTLSSRLVYDVEPYVVVTFGFMRGDGIEQHVSFDVDAVDGDIEYEESDDTGEVTEAQEAVALALLQEAFDDGSGYAVEFSAASVRFIVRQDPSAQQVVAA